MQRTAAEMVSRLCIRHGQELDSSLKQVLAIEGESADYSRYRDYVALVMAEALLEVLNPIFAEHPDLKPLELR